MAAPSPMAGPLTAATMGFGKAITTLTKSLKDERSVNFRGMFAKMGSFLDDGSHLNIFPCPSS